MLDDMLDTINIAQLEMLGIRDEHLYIGLIICGVVIVAIISYLLVSLCLYFQWKHAVMYVIYSLGCLFFIRHPPIPMPFEISIGVVLKAISIIGWCLAFYLFIPKKQRIGKSA